MKHFLHAASFLLGISVVGAQTVAVTDADINAGQTVNWVNTNTYLLDGPVYVEAGATLNIQAGTVIKGKVQSQGAPASALFISRGGKINAVGTPTQPIIFTAEADVVANPADLDETDRGLWGGLVVLGYGLAKNGGVDTFQVEGVAGNEPRALMGGTNNADNSGTLKYVSIRHAGFEIGPGNELNGLTLGAVGSGTTLEYIEVFACSDDGIEFFGGAVNLKYAVSSMNSDDSFDWDLGYRGKGQFWFAIQASDEGNHLFELDGAIPDGGPLWSQATLFNATLIGSGAANTTNPNNTISLLFRDATGGFLNNSIVYDYAKKGLEVEDLAAASGIDSYKRMQDGDLAFNNNIWYAFGAGNTLDTAGFLKVTNASTSEDGDCSDLIAHLGSKGNAVADPGLLSIARTAINMLDPRPDGNVAQVTSNLFAYPNNDPFFTPVTYKGAFAPNGTEWLRGWTALDQNGYLKVNSSIEVAQNQVNVYPNPASSVVTVSLNGTAQSAQVVLSDIAGKIILTANGNTQGMNLDLSTVPAGMYVLNVHTATGTGAVKLVVNH
jgi:hypothetical protein